MSQPKCSPECPESLKRLRVTFIPFLDLDDPIIVRVAREAGHTISRDFILEVDVGDGRSKVVRVEVFACSKVKEFDSHVGANVV